MAEEIKTASTAPESTPEVKVPSSSTVVNNPTPVATTPKKANKALIALLILLFLIAVAGSFYAGRVTAPASLTPTPTNSVVHEAIPTEVPTKEAATPTTAAPTSTVATPTTATNQTTTPTTAVPTSSSNQ